jgi:predicted nucleic acid-binding protein
VIVILDTNVLYNDYLFKQASLQAIIREKILGYRVAISTVTLFEHASHYRKDRKEAARMLRRLGVDERAVLPVDDNDERAIIRKNSEVAGIEILPLPTVAHEILIDRAIRGLRPFTQDGKQGYRDALIWETIKAYATSEDVTLIAQDNDFGKKDLSPELREEANDLPHLVTRYKEYDQFLEEFVAPKLKASEGLENELKSGKRQLSTTAEFLRLLNLELELYSSGASSKELGLPNNAHLFRIEPLNRPPELVDVSARLLGDGDVLLRLTLSTRVDVLAEYRVYMGEDYFEPDYEGYDIPVTLDVTAITASDLTSINSLSIERVEQNEDADEPPHEHGRL